MRMDGAIFAVVCFTVVEQSSRYKAKNVIVIKRGRGAGFAGIENALFYNPKTRMLFGDAKATVTKLVTALQAKGGTA